MLWLIVHMWFLLVLAFSTGIGIGWWIWGTRSAKPATRQDETTLGTLESDYAPPEASQKND